LKVQQTEVAKMQQQITALAQEVDAALSDANSETIT
jgi:hypothetical protein